MIYEIGKLNANEISLNYSLAYRILRFTLYSTLEYMPCDLNCKARSTSSA